MKIFNIYTVNNQIEYEKEDYAMVLAHLLKKNLYKSEHFKNCTYIIMDNGAYEDSQVSKSLADLVSLANKSPFIIDELVIPDVIGDYEATKKLYKDNHNTMYAYRDDYHFMYVAQVSDYDQLKESIEMLNAEKYVKVVLGVPKHCGIDRTSRKAIELYKTCKVPIHFLGIRDNYVELFDVKNLIRSCDSIQLSYLARDYSVQDRDLAFRNRLGNAIDLEKDTLNNTKIDLTRVVVNKELKKNGIL